MQQVLIALIIGTVFFGGTYWYVSTAEVCPVPLAYRLGAYDERFSLPREEIPALLAEAESAWETATGRELLVYDESARFVVDFVFDERQRRAVSEEELRAVLDEKERQTAETKETLEGLESEYQRIKQVYETRRRAYDRKLAAYNARVDAVNAEGGAPPEQAEELNAEKRSLEIERNELEASARSLNELVSDINELGEYGNQLVDDYNEDVMLYNDRFGEGGAFTQGEYSGEAITIYKYSDRTELLKVITHELGHSLGLSHVEDSAAIMYYLLEQQPESLTLQRADVEEFARVCGTGNEVPHRLRRLINQALSYIS